MRKKNGGNGNFVLTNPGWLSKFSLRWQNMYRVTLVVVDLGWVDFDFGHSIVGLCLAESGGQLGEMVEHPAQSQPNPGLRPPESPCISNVL